MLSGLESPTHIAILVVILILLFGAKRLPEIGRSLGTGLREFKQSITADPPRSPPGLEQRRRDGEEAPPGAPGGEEASPHAME